MNTPLRRSGMVRVLKGSQFYLHTLRSSANGMNHTSFAFPAEAGTHLPTPEGWKAELALGGWLVTYWNKCPAPEIEPGHGSHLSTNRVRRWLTLLIKANALTTTPDHQPCVISACRVYVYMIMLYRPGITIIVRCGNVREMEREFYSKMYPWKWVDLLK